MYQPQDSFFKKAKDEGYPARSVYKLKELDQRFRLFKANQSILDLGCAPGSWSLYISQRIGPKGLVLGIDLQEVKISADNFVFFKQNVFDINQEYLKELMSGHKTGDCFDGIVSDLAPSTSGVKGLDAARSALLAEKALELAGVFLKNGGFLVVKILEGGEHGQIWRKIKDCFRRQKQVRPRAVRRNSREIYIVANGFKRGELVVG